MELCLTAEEVRVLGCLLEKKMATPEYYPLSLNALVNACNQKVNRDPVVNYDEHTVDTAVEGLRSKQLIWINTSGRVDKFAEGLVERFELPLDQAAVLCILLLRGPQTVGEIRGRTERLHAFADLEAVHQTLETLTEKAFVTQAARQPGRKERRYEQLLGSATESSTSETMIAPAETIPPQAPDRISELEERVTQLAERVADLEKAFALFKQQFE